MPHVASSVERATTYLREKRPADADDLLATARMAVDESGLTKKKQKKLARCVRTIRDVLPPPFLALVEPTVGYLEALGRIRIYADKRTQLANQILWRVDNEGREAVTPMVLLALAVAVGCEPPTGNSKRQTDLYETWKKRHAGINEKLNDYVHRLAKAMSRRPRGKGIDFPGSRIAGAETPGITGKLVRPK